MIRISRFSICLLFILSISTLLSAQEERGAVGPKLSPVITASTTGEKVVRFGSPAAGLAQIRVQIVSASGALIFDSAWKDGNVLDWPIETALADGSYHCTIMVKDVSGQVAQREAVIVARAGQVAIEPEAENADPKITLLVHDEKDGALVNTSGDLSFRLGKFFAGKDAERMRLTAEGNLGLGTDKPQAKLDVNGMIRASEGIMFSDGTVLRMANGEVVVEKAASANPNARRVIQTLLPTQSTAIPRRLTPSPTVSPDYQFKVDGSGVHIGTTPAFGLDVAGNVTLSSNLALPVTAAGGTAGVITLGGNRFAHAYGSSNTFIGQSAGNFTMTGYDNTATGYGALLSNQIGYSNTGTGAGALQSNQTGYGNTATGDFALQGNNSGTNNTAIGRVALYSNQTGYDNTAIGASALVSNQTGYGNTAVGANSLSNTTGAGNVALGRDAGLNLTTGDNNIDIRNAGVAAESGTIRIGTSGLHTKAFLAGVFGVTTALAAVPLLVDPNGQLGTASSSRRYKFDIDDMGDKTNDLMRLRPVTFRYLAHGDNAPLQYGMTAEEVAEVYPELVVRNKDGEPESVMYQFLAPMLLNEVQKQHRQIEEQHRLNEEQQRTIDALSIALGVVGRRLHELEREIAIRR
jgi:hypothetical protein